MNLHDLLRPALVDVNIEVENWEEAIRAAGRLILDDGAIEARFIEAMIQVAKDLGPYIVIAPGIALPHARPEDGVIKASMGLITLNPPIEFGNERNDPVHIVVSLAAKDNEQHVEGLAQLAAVLSKPELVDGLKNAETKESLIEIIFSLSGDGVETKTGTRG